MFTATYFTPTYFAPTYFAEVGSSSTPPSLLAAIEAKLIADSTLSAITGGFWKDQKPAKSLTGTQYPGPYVTITRLGSTELWRTKTSRWQSEKIRFRVHVTNASDAETYGDLIIASVSGWQPIDYANGFVAQIHEAGSSSNRVTKLSVGELSAWTFDTVFIFECKRGA
jgi:hypothetical protein